MSAEAVPTPTPGPTVALIVTKLRAESRERLLLLERERRRNTALQAENDPRTALRGARNYAAEALADALALVPQETR